MPLDIRIRFGRAIRRIREEQKINQEEAAERCGLHRTYIMKPLWTNELHNKSDELLIKRRVTPSKML
jgi:transcriptional regulator with XRE-family HTH domain